MQIVINIREDFLYKIKHKHPNMRTELEQSVLDGTILPKGHGRLGDLDALEKEIVNGIKAGNYDEGYDTFAHINDMDDCIECVKFADTIIEADKSESEEV